MGTETVAAEEANTAHQQEHSATLLHRRSSDARVMQLAEDVAVLKVQMVENTIVTMQVRDILSSFKVMASVAKWVTAIAGMIAALVAMAKGVDFRR